MRRTGLAVVVALVLALTATAVLGGGFVLDSIVAQVYSEKVTMVDAGVSTYANYSDTMSGTINGVAPNAGNVTALWDKFGVTNETRWLRIVTVVKDVKSQQIIDIKQAFVTPENKQTNDGIVCKVVSPYEIWIDTQSLPEFTRFSPVVVQNASTKEHRIIWIFRSVSHIERENSADVFITRLDISDELSEDLVGGQPQLGLTQTLLESKDRPKAVSRLLRAYVYSRYPIQLTRTSAPYQIVADGRAQAVQGMAQDQTRDAIARLTAAYEKQAAESKATIDNLVQKLNASKPQNWSIGVGPSPTGAWYVWLDGGPKMRVAADTVSFNTLLGTHWVEVVPEGDAFKSWHRCVVTQAGQQLDYAEVK